MKSLAPVFDSGPFRVNLVNLHYQRDVNFPMVPRVETVKGARPSGLRNLAAADARPGPAINEVFFAQLSVVGEPRLNLTQRGPIKDLEAFDDQGQSLVAPATRPGAFQRGVGEIGFPGAGGFVTQFQTWLVHPRVPGATIRTLKGVLPVAVSSRKPGPLLAPLEGASGGIFQNEAVTLTVHEIRKHANSLQTNIEITLRVRPTSTGSRGVLEGGSQAPLLPGAQSQQIEVLDAQGRLIPWFQTSLDAEGERLTLTLTPASPDSPPASLRVYSLVVSTADVPFEFRDVPLP
jgi:hypothetical protein